jgi:exodeoxyribonuclease V alpha subunit
MAWSDSDHLRAETVLGLDGRPLLRQFNLAGVLTAVDVHVALRLGRLCGETDELVELGAAFAIRAPRVGHVYVDLATVRSTATADLEEEVDLDALPWPGPGPWAKSMAASRLTTPSSGPGGSSPLRLEGTALYLDRYWQDEVAVAQDLVARARARPPLVDQEVLQDGLGRLFPRDDDQEQREAVQQAVVRMFSVVAGGPGTGKTTTVARLLALLEEQAASAGASSPLVALAAPTGKAAARMGEAVREAAEQMDIAPYIRERLRAQEAYTMHRLLAPQQGSSNRFRYGRLNHLPHDVIIVDETSMVSLWLMARLTEAIRADARLVLVGDPQQLASVEAGAILADVVGPPVPPSPEPPGRHQGLSHQREAPGGSGRFDVDNCISVLRTNHRFHDTLATLADAVRSGDEEATFSALRAGDPGVVWVAVDVHAGEQPPEILRNAVTSAASHLVEAALSGNHRRALEALDHSRLLCAHRLGPAGVADWNSRVEAWLAAEVPGFVPEGAWFVGRPVIITANDYSLGLFNGDMGVTVPCRTGPEADKLGVLFERAGGPFVVSPSRLQAIATAYAMTVHRSQGSEAEEVVVLLPPPTSRILTRELLYTAVTRARRRLVLVGTAEPIIAALGRPVARASGLSERLRSRALDAPSAAHLHA